MHACTRARTLISRAVRRLLTILRRGPGCPPVEPVKPPAGVLKWRWAVSHLLLSISRPSERWGQRRRGRRGRKKRRRVLGRKEVEKSRKFKGKVWFEATVYPPLELVCSCCCKDSRLLSDAAVSGCRVKSCWLQQTAPTSKTRLKTPSTQNTPSLWPCEETSW